MRHLLTAFLLAGLAACGEAPQTRNQSAPDPEPTAAPAPAPDPAPSGIAAILDAQPDDVKARYQYRNPQETIEFFGIEPGMTVVEVLPGGGWYSKLLLPHLGSDGELVGANYAPGIWTLFGMPEERIQQMATWATDWPQGANEWRGPDDASISAFVLGTVPEERKGTADAVLFIRALHNMARFESQGGFMSQSMQNAFDVLKPGGVVGIVQHAAREDMPDEWADGSAGYLKESFVVAEMEKAGFELMGTSDINANSNDQPTTDDIVWRLPPSLRFARDDEALRAEMEGIGESNRMTLKFRKPA